MVAYRHIVNIYKYVIIYIQYDYNWVNVPVIFSWRFGVAVAFKMPTTRNCPGILPPVRMMKDVFYLQGWSYSPYCIDSTIGLTLMSSLTNIFFNLGGEEI